MQESPSVRADSTENITSRFRQRQKESNIANTGGAKQNSMPLFGCAAYRYEQVKAVEEQVH